MRIEEAGAGAGLARTASGDEHARRTRGSLLRRDYRRRARGLWVVALAAALAWYGATAVESRSMGYGPFVRRPFTLFDWVLYAVLVAGFLLAVRRIRRCPRCGHGFGFARWRSVPPAAAA